MTTSLGIDFGSKFIGLALVEHTNDQPNRVLYAGTIEVAAKPLNGLVETRAQTRRIRRTRKTHKRRLQRLAQATRGIPNIESVLRFCRRRGFSYDVEGSGDDEQTSLHIHRDEFFEALKSEIGRQLAPGDRDRVFHLCQRHLNDSCKSVAELRPARFENRGPTKCVWEGCRHNVPRAGNDFLGRLQQGLFVWLKPVFDESSDPARLRRSVDHWVLELDALARAMARNAKLADEVTRKQNHKSLNLRIRRVYKNLLSRVTAECSEEVREAFAANWEEHYRKNLGNIIRQEQTGRVRYCRHHSTEFVDHFLGGKPIPNRVEITEADLISRKQQIVFQRLWRLVESRLLPLALGRIDRIVVERVAFDTLAGSFDKRLHLPEQRAAEMYWYGPQFGFESRQAMLSAEFDELCAYCGERCSTSQTERNRSRADSE